MIRQIWLVTSLLLLSVGVTAAAKIESAPRTYVEDRARLLSADQKRQLIGLLQELEQKTGARIIVLTVDTTGDIPIEKFAFERADQWKFGQNRKSASALVVVAVKDRKYRIEVGYEHEGVLPDGYVGTVGRRYFVPNFKAGRYGQGVFDGTAVIAQHIAEDKDVILSGMPRIRTSPNMLKRGSPFGALLPLLFFWILLSRRRTRGMLFWGLLGGTILSGGRSYSGGFGGGGFGGGGGGGFGGGGASGSW